MHGINNPHMHGAYIRRVDSKAHGLPPLASSLWELLYVCVCVRVCVCVCTHILVGVYMCVHMGATSLRKGKTQ